MQQARQLSMQGRLAGGRIKQAGNLAQTGKQVGHEQWGAGTSQARLGDQGGSVDRDKREGLWQVEGETARGRGGRQHAPPSHRHRDVRVCASVVSRKKESRRRACGKACVGRCMLCALVLQRGGGWGSAEVEGTAAGAAVLRRERRGRAFRGQARMSGLGCGLCGKKTSRVVGRARRRAIRGYVEKQATISLKTLGRLEWRHRVGAGRQQQTMVGGEARGAAGCTAQRGDSPATAA